MNDPENKSPEKDPFDINIQSCSTMDCTGLIPSLPQDEAEQEAYEDLYPYITMAVKDGGGIEG